MCIPQNNDPCQKVISDKKKQKKPQNIPYYTLYSVAQMYINILRLWDIKKPA